ncbi:hypothetical protein [Candidatus Methylacidiphilum infernorum]|uniref:Uncharacterized protein n=1 Tax=Methylacidiphilum infernorum (isolate V4) TaxID=481448 RepID=B3DVT2_METI4|nr:hypothetical protein [Candidatus Methylacidiphilum infernorum]ACD83435.1 Hypothetical protein Minf_1381 [Methylacidiphilum infernorum V4]
MNINDVIAFIVSSFGTLVGLIVLFLLFGGWILALVGATVFSSFFAATPSRSTTTKKQEEQLAIKEEIETGLPAK